MKWHKFAFVVVFSLSNIIVYAGPRLSFDKDIVDLGKLYGDEQIPVNLTCHNVGDSILEISVAGSSCGCITTDKGKTVEISPKAQHTFPIVISAIGKSDTFQNAVYFKTNDESVPLKAIQFTGSIIPNFTFAPPIISGDIPFGEKYADTIQVKVINKDITPVKIDSKIQDILGITLKKKQENEWIISTESKGILTQDIKTTVSLNFITSDTTTHAKVIPIDITVGKPLFVSPTTLLLESNDGKEILQKIIVSKRMDKEIKFLSVETDAPIQDVYKISSEFNNTEQQLSLKFEPKALAVDKTNGGRIKLNFMVSGLPYQESLFYVILKKDKK
jgi:hypothetical protein